MRSTCTKLLIISWYHSDDTRMCHKSRTSIGCTHKVPFCIIAFMCHVVVPATTYYSPHDTRSTKGVAFRHPHGAPCTRYVIATGKVPIPIKSTCTQKVLPAWLFTTIRIHILEQGKKRKNIQCLIAPKLLMFHLYSVNPA